MGGGGGGSQQLLSPNPTTVLVVLLLGLWLWLLLGCDNYCSLQVVFDSKKYQMIAKTVPSVGKL